MVDVVNKTRTKINLSLAKKVAEKFLDYYKIPEKDVSIAFVGDKKMKDLNKAYRNKDKTTDVLSFEGEDDFFGEIIINPQQVKRQAKKYSKTVKDELVFILVHGLLHLLGYNDEKDKDREEMIDLGEEFITKNNL